MPIHRRPLEVRLSDLFHRHKYAVDGVTELMSELREAIHSVQEHRKRATK